MINIWDNIKIISSFFSERISIYTHDTSTMKISFLLLKSFIVINCIITERIFIALEYIVEHFWMYAMIKKAC